MNRVEARGDLASVRDTLRSSTDRRVAATRTRIYEAVRTLASSDAEISVSSVTAAAGISRATFYTHFSGVDDLALHLQEQAFHEIAVETRAAASFVDQNTMWASQRALISHYATFRPFYAGVFTIAVPRGVESRVAEFMRGEILTHIREFTRPPDNVDPAVAATYISHAAVGTIVGWVLGDVTATEDELALHLLQLMPQWMHTRISRSPEIPADTHLKEQHNEGNTRP